MSTVTLNQPLPEFTAQATNGELQSSDLQGQATVLFFYPKNNTPGCTTESKGFRDHYAEFTAANCRVIGISRDTMGSHQRVIKKLELPYPLIADPEEAICNLFGVMKEKNMFGKKVKGIERSTFLIDSQGNLVQEWRKVKVPGHVEEVLAAAQALT